jgi:hypothetical protein
MKSRPAGRSNDETTPDVAEARAVEGDDPGQGVGPRQQGIDRVPGQMVGDAALPVRQVERPVVGLAHVCVPGMTLSRADTSSSSISPVGTKPRRR